MKKISIVVPAHNEEANIPLLVKEVESVFSTLKDFTYELVIVDDGSRDNTINVIKDESQKNTNIKYLEFSKNFGKEAATSAGIHYASGDAVLSLDADLQHPPSLVPDFIKKWEEGYDVVIGVRTKNMGTTFVKRFLSALYYKIINSISTTEIVRGATDYRLIDRRVVDEFNRLTEHERMTRGLIDWLG
jgi:dolichol-phosphate mannosyltransferase